MVGGEVRLWETGAENGKLTLVCSLGKSGTDGTFSVIQWRVAQTWSPRTLLGAAPCGFKGAVFDLPFPSANRPWSYWNKTGFRVYRDLA